MRCLVSRKSIALCADAMPAKRGHFNAFRGIAAWRENPAAAICHFNAFKSSRQAISFFQPFPVVSQNRQQFFGEVVGHRCPPADEKDLTGPPRTGAISPSAGFVAWGYADRCLTYRKVSRNQLGKLSFSLPAGSRAGSESFFSEAPVGLIRGALIHPGELLCPLRS